MMVSFVDKKELQNNRDLLSAHAQWEVNYWHQHASRVESNIREDLIGTGKDVKVTANLCLETWILKKPSGCHRKPRRSVKPTSNTYAEELRIQIVMTERTQRRIMQSYSAVSKRASLHSWIWKRSKRWSRPNQRQGQSCKRNS